MTAEEGHGSALQKGNNGKGPAPGDTWKDIVYLVGFSQVLSLFTQWGFTFFWTVVPAYGAYNAWGTAKGFFNQVRSLMPEVTPEQLDGKEKAKEDEGELAKKWG